MPKIPTLVELLEAGVHFGHQESKTHPKAKPFIYSANPGVQIINLEKTIKKLEQALDFIKDQVAEGKQVLFLGTKPQARKIVRENAEKVKMPYIIERWIGGTLTNFSEVSKLIKKLKKLEKSKEQEELKKYTKKEQANFNKEIEKINKIIGGLRGLEKIPSIIFVIGVKREKTAVAEAKKMKIPIVALVDTNVNPEKIDYVIPANDDGIKSLNLIVGLVSKAVEEGIKGKKVEKQETKKGK